MHRVKANEWKHAKECVCEREKERERVREQENKELCCGFEKHSSACISSLNNIDYFARDSKCMYVPLQHIIITKACWLSAAAAAAPKNDGLKSF